MSREQVMRQAREVFDHANQVRATRTGADCLGIRAVAIEAALAWAAICRYMDTTGADCFQMDAYRKWALRPVRVFRKYLRLFRPSAHDYADELAKGTSPLGFYRFR